MCVCMRAIVCVCVCVCAGADAAPTGTKGVLSDVSVCLRACANPIASTLMFLRSCCCGSNALCFLRCGTTSHMSRCYSSCVCVSLPHTCRGGFRFCVCVALPHTCRNGFLLVFVWHCLTHVAMVSFLCLCSCRLLSVLLPFVASLATATVRTNAVSGPTCQWIHHLISNQTQQTFGALVVHRGAIC